ncbi:type II toxin-antitoxin system RelE/ParE family toxin [Longimicrobium terrae]|uniref:Plasmid stabilization system protein ParE n=1 Tax=Longimicrobium terrae TaxID=1639882 RepID=A0A841H4E7_9BACT|nr:plasmid stabilization system protein ParE [Longimicrobium terrae]MBB6072880.1 plasmid stabilization system protein ParE [Longimicrobium terrae]NNC31495.1 type II toxin-antitoxin system RelE/ParE family toxin [Longimicrobium terrae]
MEEFLDAVRFYRDQNPDIASRFDQDFALVLSMIRERPLLGTPHRHGTRRKLFPRFPYAVIYTIGVAGTVVYAVFHQHREPEYWADRLEPFRPG